MSDKDTRNTRRQILRGITGSIASVPAVVTGVSATSEESTIDTTFDPTKKRETQQFIRATFEESERIHRQSKSAQVANDRIRSVRERILDSLDGEQAEAIGTALADTQLRIERRPVIHDSDAGETPKEAWDYAKFSETVTANIEIRFLRETPYEAFDFTHQIEWEHKPLEGVRAINATGSGSGNHYILAYWDYRGTDDEDITIRQDGNFFTSDMTGIFEGCLFIGGWSCQRNDRMYTRTAGNWNGTGSLVRSELQ